jgi:tetratricopeptide (TPR) repeat protein
MKNTMWKFLGIGLAAAIVISPAARAQMGQQQQGMGQGMGSQSQTMGTTPQQSQGQQGTQATPPQTPPATQPPASAEEEAAYKKVAASSDPKQLIADATDFLKKFPASRYNASVYAQLSMAYFLQGDGDKAGAAAQKALQLNPTSPDALPVMAMVTSHQIPGGPGSAPKIQATENYANQGIQQLNALTKPAEISDADFTAQRNVKLAMCHSALGLAYLHEGKGSMAVQHLLEATKLETPPDAMDTYLLAVAYDATNQFGLAVTSFEAACPKLQGEMQQRCNDLLKEEKKKAPKQ